MDGWRFCYKTKPWESPEVIRSGAGDLQEFARSSCDHVDSMPVAKPRGGGCCGGSCQSDPVPAPAPASIRSGGGGCASCSGR